MMKLRYTVTTICVFAFLTTKVIGQIPNNGFENWTNMGTYLNPEGWWTTNDFITSGSFYPVTRSTDHFPSSVGNYSIRLENNTALFPNWGGFGLTWTGDINGSDNPVFPVNGHPASLWGYYKFMPQNNDTMEIHIRLYKNGTDLSGGSYKTSVAALGWTPFSMIFSNYVDADSARIFMSTCYDSDAPVPHGNSVLYIDNLNFDTLITTGIPDIMDDNEIFVYPNPASDKLTLAFPDNIAKQTDLKIFNDFGQNVFIQNIASSQKTFKLDVSKFLEGTYFLCVTTDKKVVYTKRIIISK